MATVLPILYVLDTSGSMAGTRMDSLNGALAQIHQRLLDNDCKIASIEVEIAVITFSMNAKLRTDCFQSPRDLPGHYHLETGGMTNLGSALMVLGNLLRLDTFHREGREYLRPLILFSMDGYPTDNEWQGRLQQLQDHNRVWRHSRRYALALGADADQDVLQQVVGDEGKIFYVDDWDLYEDTIANLFSNEIVRDYLVQDNLPVPEEMLHD